MKKFLSLLAIGLIFACMSCNGDKTEKTAGDTTGDKKDNSMAEKNLAGVHAVNDAFATGDVSKLDSFIASNIVDHTMNGDKVGLDSLKSMIVSTHAKMKDAKMEIIKELADNDYVMAWLRFTGTGDGTMGMPNGPYDMRGLEIVKFKDGKVVEHWEYVDPVEMMKMMGPQPGTKMENKK